jgi:GPH family glycoside/pentoside/hexuronide:cation symporter
MMYYFKYSLGIKEGDTTIVLAIVFVGATLMLYPWRQLIARHTDSRTTLIIANAVMIAAVIPFGFAESMALVYVSADLMCVGVSGLILIGDVIMSEVVDEDEVKMGEQRAGMFFGMSGFLITLSTLLVSAAFGIILPLFGYDTMLDKQPESVNMGVRVFMTVPAIIGFLLAILALYIYPLHGQRLKDIKTALEAKEKAKSEATAG